MLPYKDREKNKAYLREYGKKWRPAHPGYWRKYNWRIRGVDPNKAEIAYFAARSCAVCGRELSGHLKHLDHDHRTGRIRGVLCQSCNQAMGLFGEDGQTILKAMEYLLRHSSIGSSQ